MNTTKKVLFLGLMICLCLFTGCDSKEYNEANRLFEEGRYNEALVIFEGLEDYENAKELVSECKYSIAGGLYESNELVEAIAAYSELGDYKDSLERVSICKYELACTMFSEGDYAGALQYFAELDGYNDSNDKLLLCEREIGMTENADYDFLADIEQSVISRMDAIAAGSNDTLALTNTELAYLEEYLDLSFYDAELEELAHKYIEGLLIQKEATKKVHRHEFQIEWQKGLVCRYGALLELYESYDLLNDNAEFIGFYIAQYDDHKALLEAYYAIEADIEAQLTDDILWNYSGGKVHYTVKNNTSYTYSTVFQMYFYDENGTQYESGEISIENITPGSSYVVSIYLYDVGRFDHLEWFNYYTDVK